MILVWCSTSSRKTWGGHCRHLSKGWAKARKDNLAVTVGNLQQKVTCRSLCDSWPCSALLNKRQQRPSQVLQEVVGHIKQIAIAIGFLSTPRLFLYLAWCPTLSELRLTFLIPTSIAWSVHIIDLRYISSSFSNNFAQVGVKEVGTWKLFVHSSLQFSLFQTIYLILAKTYYIKMILMLFWPFDLTFVR